MSQEEFQHIKLDSLVNTGNGVEGKGSKESEKDGEASNIGSQDFVVARKMYHLQAEVGQRKKRVYFLFR